MTRIIKKIIFTAAGVVVLCGFGEVRFYTYYLKERVTVHYKEGDKILPDGMKRIEQLFRSRESGRELPIDPRLIELIEDIQNHFDVRQVEIISGYRSTAFNKELKATGHNVANESFHTKGMAADIHLDEIDEKTLRDYALSLGKGGVGFYPSLDFVHVDVGPVRTWGEDSPRKAWIGEKNEASPMLLTVSPTRRIGDKKLPDLKIEGAKESDLDIRVEFFDGGVWKDAGPWTGGTKDADSLPFGKFRLKATVKGESDQYQYSNEFYFKRI